MHYIYDPAQDVSQHRTEEIIFRFFSHHPPAYHLLVDVGAFGRDLSNTFALLRRGWKGLLIEANPDRLPLIAQEFAGLSVEILNIGIGDEISNLPFYLHKTVGWDSFCPDWQPQDLTDQVLTVPVFPLANVLYGKNFPKNFDLLSIDAEGFDRKIIAHLFARSVYRPSLIVVEASSFSSSCSLFTSYGYDLFGVAGSIADGNLVFSHAP